MRDIARETLTCCADSSTSSFMIRELEHKVFEMRESNAELRGKIKAYEELRGGIIDIEPIEARNL